MMSLDPMLKARSVAVVGASERAGSVGDQTVRQLISGGFEGAVHPVNPRYESVHGINAVPSLEDIGSSVDLAVLAVANGQLETEMEKALSIWRTLGGDLRQLSRRGCGWRVAPGSAPRPGR